MQNFNNFQGCGGYNYIQPQRNEYAFVDGIEGARAFQCRPNSIMLLMDSQMPICYKKSVNGYGQTTSLEIFDLVPHKEETPSNIDYISRKEFEEFKASLNKVSDNA